MFLISNVQANCPHRAPTALEEAGRLPSRYQEQPQNSSHEKYALIHERYTTGTIQ